MKNYSMLLLLALSVSATTYAQVQTQTLNADVDAELDRMYKASQVHTRVAQQQPVVSQTILVPQSVQQQTGQTAVQTQPTTVIEATPLANSKADAIRKNRQEEEMRTESKIVEKLEQSRMEDEKRRANLLFGDKFETMQAPAAAVTTTTTTPVATTTQTVVTSPVVAAPAPVAVQPVTPVVVEPAKDSLSREAVREEIRAAIDDKEMMAAAETQKEMYIAGLAGFPMAIGTSDTSANNIKGKSSLGISVGTRLSENLMIEGGFVMSNYSADEVLRDYNGYFLGYRNYDLKQYSGIFATKYQMMNGKFRPVIGGLAVYSYRQYSYNGGGYIAGGSETGDSHALDLGILGGLDFELSKSFAIGMDVKYMINISNKVNANYQYAYAGQYGKPVEQLPWMIIGATARLSF